MRIALLGTRGIPANYGGFETFAEELSARLAARGHEVTVYSRTPYPQPCYRGVRLQYLPPFAISTSILFAMPCFRRSTCWASLGRGALLQRRQRHLHRVAADVRHAGGAECGRHRAPTQEVEPARQGLVPGFRTAIHVLPHGGGHRCAGHRGLLPPPLRQTDRLHSIRRGGGPGGRLRDARETGTRARPVFPLREPHGTGEPSARSARGVRAGDNISEAGSGRRCSLRPRLHPPRARYTGSAHRDARRHLRRGYHELGSYCFAYIHATRWAARTPR